MLFFTLKDFLHQIKKSGNIKDIYEIVNSARRYLNRDEFEAVEEAALNQIFLIGGLRPTEEDIQRAKDFDKNN